MHGTHCAHRTRGEAGSAGSFTFASTSRKYARARPFHVHSLELDVALDFDQRELTGKARLGFERRSATGTKLVLDAIGFELSSVKLDKVATHYDYDGEQIVIPIGTKTKSGTVEIRYRVRPERGLYFLAPDADVKDRPVQAWTQCQDEDARHWFPCLDDPQNKMTTAVRVTVPRGFVALSNGELIRSSQENGSKQWTYSFKLDQPHPSYLVTLVAGKFDVVDDRPAKLPSGKIVPVRYYVPPGRAADARRCFGKTPQMIELFSRQLGVEFPWSRYSQVVVHDFVFGGMENTTATTLYENALYDERASIDITSDDLIAHELAHQWFGDYVTCNTWSEAWLNEGFATLMEAIELESRLGKDEYEHAIQSGMDAYVGETKGRYGRPVVCRDYDEPIDLFDRHLYDKGAVVLHLLRRRVGDAVFWQAIRRYLEANAFGPAQTADLQAAFETTTGEPFDRFFDEWLHTGGHPELEVTIRREEATLSIQLEQKQKAGPASGYHFDAVFVYEDAAGKLQRIQKSVDARRAALQLKLKAPPRWIAFDPDFAVAAELKLRAPTDLLHAQLWHAPTARLRCQAVTALGKVTTGPNVAQLGKCLASSAQPWMVRAEAANALGEIRGTASFAALRDIATTENAKVRVAVAKALGKFRNADSASVLLPLAKKDKSYLVAAAATLALGKTRDARARGALEAQLGAVSWADVIGAAAVEGLAELRDEDVAPLIRDQTRYGRPSRRRRAAIRALGRLSDTRITVDTIADHFEDADPHVRLAALGALGQIGTTRAKGKLNAQLGREWDGRVKRHLREELRRGSDTQTEPKLRRQLDELELRVTELQSRLRDVEGAQKAAPKPGWSKTAKSKTIKRKGP